MFESLRQSLKTGVVTTSYPDAPAAISNRARGKPEIDWANWKDARAAAAICPTGAIDFSDDGSIRTAWLDLGKCIFCGLCADVDPAIRMTNQCELATRQRAALKFTSKYLLNSNDTHQQQLEGPATIVECGDSSPLSAGDLSPSKVPRRARVPCGPSEHVLAGKPAHSIEEIGQQLQKRIHSVLGRSLQIREVDAGSCNGCEVEIVGLNSPIYDIERFGIHFVASPRHADMLLVTGPVTRNMELALRKTYDATPDPRLVVAVGACGCSGGIFGQNYATCGGGVDSVIPVDVYIPGCPPNPHALLHGILLAIGRIHGPR